MNSSTAKLLIAAALFAVAIIVFVKFGMGPAEQAVLAEDAKKPDFVCLQCAAHFQAAAEEPRQARPPAGGAQEGEGQAPRVRGGRTAVRRPTTITCPKCGGKTAVAAAHCSRHDVYYPVTELDGSRGKCPKCP